LFYGQSVLSGISRYDNLFIARTFSKAYGLAGLRVGALIGSAKQMEMVRRVSSPYNVNAAALAALPVALSDQDYVADYLRQVIEGRMRVQQFFAEAGLEHWPSHANFVLVRIGPKYRDFIQALQQRGILVRDRNSDAGCAGCVRITIGTREHTDVLLAAMTSVLCEVGVTRKREISVPLR
jgi:histidinol-phosphate aminotransferase